MLLPQVVFDHSEQHFVGPPDVDAMVPAMDLPLSLTFQLTRACNYKCVYCSEPPGIPQSSLPELKRMIDSLRGMRRIILSGGEPMLHKNFWEILEFARERFEIVVLSTNGSQITRENAPRLRELVDYVDITVDGPRRQHDSVRGHYDQVMRGLVNVAAQEIPRSVICVLLEQNREAMHYICQTADAVGAHKVKILTPIPKGHSKSLFRHFVTGEHIENVRRFLEEEKARNGWRVRITITDWMRVGQGHAILVEPDGRMVASPVWDDPECIRPFGSLATEEPRTLWQRYPYKDNHLRKYLEHSLIVV